MAPSDYGKYQWFAITFPHEYVAQVEINRPKKLNSFTDSMFKELGEVFRHLSFDPEIRAVVLTAAGDRAFTAGLDVAAASSGGPIASTEGQGMDTARRAVALKRHILEFQDCVSAVERCEKPVIAAMFGICYGLAIDLTLCADIRVCAAGTRFCVKEVDIGLAADVGTLSRLPYANVPMSWAKEVALTAREFTPEEALRVGLVSSVHESKTATVQRALQLAKLLALKSPVAVQTTKDVMNYSRDHTVADGLERIAVTNAAMLQTQDVKDAMMSGLRKTTPKFSKL